MGTPVNLRLYSQKCQSVPFSPICQQKHYLCSRPISIDPFRPQPKGPGLQLRLHRPAADGRVLADVLGGCVKKLFSWTAFNKQANIQMTTSVLGDRAGHPRPPLRSFCRIRAVSMRSSLTPLASLSQTKSSKWGWTYRCL